MVLRRTFVSKRTVRDRIGEKIRVWRNLYRMPHYLPNPAFL